MFLKGGLYFACGVVRVDELCRLPVSPWGSLNIEATFRMELSSFWEESQSRVHSLFCTDGADAASTESLWFFFHSYFLPGTSWGDVFVCARCACASVSRVAACSLPAPAGVIRQSGRRKKAPPCRERRGRRYLGKCVSTPLFYREHCAVIDWRGAGDHGG